MSAFWQAVRKLKWRTPLRDPARACARCRHFANAADHIEREFAGLASLSSSRASVRDEDGLCALHGRYLSARASCADYCAPAPRSIPG